MQLNVYIVGYWITTFKHIIRLLIKMDDFYRRLIDNLLSQEEKVVSGPFDKWIQRGNRRMQTV